MDVPDDGHQKASVRHQRGPPEADLREVLSLLAALSVQLRTRGQCRAEGRRGSEYPGGGLGAGDHRVHWAWAAHRAQQRRIGRRRKGEPRLPLPSLRNAALGLLLLFAFN